MKRLRPGCPIEPPARGTIDARAIRLNARGVGSSQAAFAQAIGVSVKTLRNWAQRRREPTGPARVLLTLLQRDPWLVFDVANGQHLYYASGAIPQAGSAIKESEQQRATSIEFRIGLNMSGLEASDFNQRKSNRGKTNAAGLLGSLKRSGAPPTQKNAWAAFLSRRRIGRFFPISPRISPVAILADHDSGAHHVSGPPLALRTTRRVI
jgi:transcriptional regulator with XRE-family HTH domain